MGRLLVPGAFLLACGLAACATSDADPRTASLADTGKTEVFWSSLKATYRGQMNAEGDDEVIQGGIAMASEVCEAQTLDVTKVCARPEAAGEVHEIRCRMQCKAHGSTAGPTLARATLFVGGHPVELQLDRIDTVPKP